MRRLYYTTRMNINGVEYRTPGQLIEARLAEKGWTQRVLAIVLGMDETGINKLVASKRPLTAELALILEETLGVPADTLMQIQKEYDLGMAKLTVQPDAGRTIRARLFGDLPISEMIKRGWIDAADVRDVSAVEQGLTKFFGVTSPHEIEILPFAAKRTNVTTEVTPPQLVWLYRVKQIANSMTALRYSTNAVRNTIPKLHELLTSEESIRKVPRILADCGIRFIIVEPLQASKIDGVCLWLDNTHPVIGMSLRFDRVDNFWFVLRHELEHVVRLDGRDTIMLDVGLEEQNDAADNIPEAERIANDVAAEFCVPAKSIEGFIARKSPSFTDRDITGFARTLNVHPGIVVGQLQHLTKRYDIARKYLTSVRSIITPSAVVDGWGKVAPLIS